MHKKNKKTQGRKYDIAVFLYLAYIQDEPRIFPFFPSGIGEWETVMTMQQRNPGHYWNRKPLWGYINEADTEMELLKNDENLISEGGMLVSYLADKNPDKTRYYIEKCLPWMIEGDGCSKYDFSAYMVEALKRWTGADPI